MVQLFKTTSTILWGLPFSLIQQKVESLFGHVENAWFTAWFNTTKFRNPTGTNKMSSSHSKTTQNLIGAPHPEQLEGMLDLEEKNINWDSFKRNFKKIVKKLDTPIIPHGWMQQDESRDTAEANWKVFWKNLAKERKSPLGSLPTYHLLVLGYYSHYPLYRNSRNTPCKFCEVPAKDSLKPHVFENEETQQYRDDQHIGTNPGMKFIIGNPRLSKSITILKRYLI
ncbi:uncharacterized protein KGF55_003067 [Candida pseudojiufengensis]|uniref:uncharacterized protein n=1 Tax=Candida pseudojiufengensis TaxID=497109 RepID=UPI002225B576|nr:uncharacterized protein KGF55_003067 [Candida pseudojiufengensis]KAI5963275.1 hypothetical protein KGF55_003067 [Candida pseudojiufengensis]